MRKTSHLTAIIIIFIAFILIENAYPEEFKPYQSLIQKNSNEPFGHVIVQVPRERKLPEDWEMQWFVSIYTPKGFRLPLGFIQDPGAYSKQDRLVLKIPVGNFKIEITRRPDTINQSFFHIDKEIYKYSPLKAQYVSDVTAIVKQGDIKIINIDYQNPQAFKSEDKKSKVTEIIHLWENFHLSQQDGSSSDLIKGKSEIYHMIKFAAFQDIDETTLVEALKTDSSFLVVNTFLHLEKPNVKPIIEALQNKSLEFKYDTAWILASAGDKDAIPPLIELFKQGKIKYLFGLAWTLGELKATRAVPILIDRLKHRSTLVRVHSAYALGKIGDSLAVPPLIKMVRSKDCFRERKAILKNPEILISILLNAKYNIAGIELPIHSYCAKNNAIIALGMIGGEEAQTKLISLLNDPDPKIQLETIFALANKKNTLVRDALIKKLNSKHQSVRFFVALILAKFKDTHTLDVLKERQKVEGDKEVLEAIDTSIKKITAPKKKPPKKEKQKQSPDKDIKKEPESKGINSGTILLLFAILIVLAVIILMIVKKKNR